MGNNRSFSSSGISGSNRLGMCNVDLSVDSL